MSKDHDEPVYIQKTQSTQSKKQIVKEIRQLLNTEKFAVLATQAENCVHSSLITFAVTDEYKSLIFATPVETRKFEQISKSPNVSLLIDNRSNGIDDLNKLAALSISGDANEVKIPDEVEKYKTILLKRHPYLEKFLFAVSTTLILVNNIKYSYVTKFQEVKELSPDDVCNKK